MFNRFKKVLRTAENLQKKNLVYLYDNIEVNAEVNYQIIALIVEDLNLLIDQKRYEMKSMIKKNFYLS